MSRLEIRKLQQGYVYHISTIYITLCRRDRSRSSPPGRWIDVVSRLRFSPWRREDGTELRENVNYPALPRSGLPAPRLLRTGLPVSVSEFIPDVGTGIPDSAGDFPSRVVRSVPLLSNGHSTTRDGARLFSRLNTAGSVVSIALPSMTRRVVNITMKLYEQMMTVLYPLPTRSLCHSLRKGP